MLWYKGWLETRWRFFFALVIYLAVPLMVGLRGNHSHGSGGVPGIVIDTLAGLWLIIPVMLAGAGINTQTANMTTQNVHGSMLFTLSLPVSRFHLLAARAGVGALETLVLIVIASLSGWAAVAPLRAVFGPADVLAYAITVAVACSAIYGFAVLLATFLGEIWQFYGGMIGVAVVSMIRALGLLPTRIDLIGSIGDHSFLITHQIPWAALAFSVAIGVTFFLLAGRIAQRREY